MLVIPEADAHPLTRSLAAALRRGEAPPDPATLPQRVSLLAIPLFVLAAEFMNTGSIMDRLLRFCNAIVGRFRGGMAQVGDETSVRSWPIEASIAA